MKWGIIGFLLMGSILGAAEKASIRKDFDQIESLEFRGEGGMIVSQGDRNQIILEGDKQCINQIKVIMNNGRLIIENKPGLLKKGCKDFTCQLVVQNLNSIVLDGNVYFKSNALTFSKLSINMYGDSFADVDLQGESLSVIMEGNGRLIAGGKVGDQEVVMKGSAFYHGDDLDSLSAVIKIIGSGRANVSALNSLDVTITGDGKVYYAGEPKELHQNILGTGEVVQRATGMQEATTPP